MTTPPPLIFLLLLCASASFATSSTGFRVQLTHVDAKANLTMAERLRRASTRIHRRFELVGGVTAPVVTQDSGFYIAEIGIGNPPQVVQAIVTTTVAVVSTQCSTCRPRCFDQNLDYYDYHNSSTDRPVPCDDAMCDAAHGLYGTEPCTGGGRGGDDDNGGTCHIPQSTGDIVAGFLRTDEFTFGPAKVNITFSCTGQTDTVGDVFGGASGFIGLGRNALSLVSQVGSKKRFSYCLTRHTDRLHSSPLFVGSSAGLSGDAPVTSTPFAMNPYPQEAILSSFYYLSMSGLSVGEASLDIPREAFRGGVVIDTTPLTYLTDVAYMALKKEMSRKLGSSLVPSPVESLELCVARGDVGRMVPPLVLHLDGGDLALPADNYWAPIDLETSCMMVVNSGPQRPPYRGISLIGGYMQQDIHILYDLDGESISFQPADCTSI